MEKNKTFQWLNEKFFFYFLNMVSYHVFNKQIRKRTFCCLVFCQELLRLSHIFVRKLLVFRFVVPEIGYLHQGNDDDDNNSCFGNWKKKSCNGIAIDYIYCHYDISCNLIIGFMCHIYPYQNETSGYCRR